MRLLDAGFEKVGWLKENGRCKAGTKAGSEVEGGF